MTLAPRSYEHLTHASTPVEARVSDAQDSTHEKVMQMWARGLSVTGDALSTGAEFATIGIAGGTKIAAKTLFKGTRGIVRGLSA